MDVDLGVDERDAAQVAVRELPDVNLQHNEGADQHRGRAATISI